MLSQLSGQHPLCRRHMFQPPDTSSMFVDSSMLEFCHLCSRSRRAVRFHACLIVDLSNPAIDHFSDGGAGFVGAFCSAHPDTQDGQITLTRQMCILRLIVVVRDIEDQVRSRVESLFGDKPGRRAVRQEAFFFQDAEHDGFNTLCRYPGLSPVLVV